MPHASEVTLQEITADTVRAVTDLRVLPAQENYIASNAVSIAQAYFHPQAWFRAVCAGHDLVGFAMLRDDTLSTPPRPCLSLWRLMIDHRFQGRGHARAALTLLVQHARSRPGIVSMQTSYVDGPHGPKDFYLGFGFCHTGEITPKGEVCLRLALD